MPAMALRLHLTIAAVDPLSTWRPLLRRRRRCHGLRRLDMPRDAELIDRHPELPEIRLEAALLPLRIALKGGDFDVRHALRLRPGERRLDEEPRHAVLAADMPVRRPDEEVVRRGERVR